MVGRIIIIILAGSGDILFWECLEINSMTFETVSGGF